MIINPIKLEVTLGITDQGRWIGKEINQITLLGFSDGLEQPQLKSADRNQE
jgi:hypothetical protein